MSHRYTTIKSGITPPSALVIVIYASFFSRVPVRLSWTPFFIFNSAVKPKVTKWQKRQKKKIGVQQTCMWLVRVMGHNWCLTPVSWMVWVKTSCFQILELLARDCAPVLCIEHGNCCLHLYSFQFIITAILYSVVWAVTAGYKLNK